MTLPSVRKAAPQDWAKFRPIAQSCEPQVLANTDNLYWLWLNKAETAAYLAESGGDTLGYCLALRLQDSWHLHQVAVLPAFQGQGIGGLLVAALLADLRDKTQDRCTPIG